MSEPLIRLQGVCFDYPSDPVLRDVDFTLNPGERVALAGVNGAGKSTLLRLLVGLVKPRAGRIHAFGQERRSEADFREVRARAGLLFQDSDDQLFCPTVLEDIAFGPLNLGRSAGEARAIAERVLDELALSHLRDRVTHRLSGGQKRLVSLATVLAMEPEVLLLDEPTNALDEATDERLTDYLKQLPQAMVFISHDRLLVEKLANRAVILEAGKLKEAVMHRHPHQHSHLHIHAPGLADHSHPLPGHNDHGHSGL
ncbi:energy-coupling factor ABC transporter ATP-binding protein [Motiliproteus sp. SC1-56]|uniref:energy-coupling factor ABC transporter ATP-binding protein n=1 Tax=Motiliproteus sp. SC1-56 TaxID=2799565 RepID=UPI001A90129B|nr:ABC transporter ATP-binding protein [Motiliproteus sp. SC1-56]